MCIYINVYINSTISFTLEYRLCIYIMDGVFRNSYWSVEEFFLNLKNYLRPRRVSILMTPIVLI